MKTQIVHVRLTIEQVEDIKTLATAQERSFSAMTRLLLGYSLKERYEGFLSPSTSVSESIDISVNNDVH